MLRKAKESPLTDDRPKNSYEDMVTPVLCEICLKPIKKKRGCNVAKRFCSDHCRLVHWAARKTVKEYKDGKADGLRNFIEELADNDARSEDSTNKVIREDEEVEKA